MTHRLLFAAVPLLALSLCGTQSVAALSVGPNPNSSVYRLTNHPSGSAANPTYGLRLDGLEAGLGDANEIFTFDFEFGTNDVFLTYDPDAETININGQVFGGKDAGSSYDPNKSGNWTIDFTYSANVVREPGGGLRVTAEDPDNNTGTLTFDSGIGFNDGQVFGLVDFEGTFGYSFALLPDGHRLGGDNSSLVGRGWLNHSGEPHVTASDWLFKADLIQGPDISSVIPEPGLLTVWLGVSACGLIATSRRSR